MELGLADFRVWHFSDLSGYADDVRSLGQSRPRNLTARLPKMTQLNDIG
jgi:hypothetical protein